MFGFCIFVTMMIGAYLFYKKRSFITKMIIKAVAVYIMATITICGVISTVKFIGDAYEEASERTLSNRLQRAESVLRYSGIDDLQEQMIMRNDYEKKFDPYWEICEANEFYNQYRIYDRVLACNLQMKDNEKFNELKEQSKNNLKSLVEASPYDQNFEMLRNILNRLN